MISSYLTDLVDIVTESKDKWGVITSTTQSNVKARFEDINKMIRNNKGEEVTSNGHLIISDSATLTYEDKVKLKTIVGVAHQLADKKLGILKLSKAHGFSISHWEVWV